MGKRANLEEQNNGRFKKINRGTNDEFEILALIISNHPGLKISVLEKLKQAKRRTVARLARTETKPSE
jgi:hypothetical protein